jgi:hypothetical protein
MFIGVQEVVYVDIALDVLHWLTLWQFSIQIRTIVVRALKAHRSLLYKTMEG